MKVRRPPAWSRFDRNWYLARYPDTVAQMAAAGTEDVEIYYRETGSRIGHSPNMFFDEIWYLKQYPDVAKHVAAGGIGSGFEHYCVDGWRGRSPHWLFNEKLYLSLNIDVDTAYLADHQLVNGYDHYLTTGDRDFRTGHLFFDPEFLQQTDVDDDRIADNAEGPFTRYLGYLSSGRDEQVSRYFDPIWYLRTYPEVVAELKRGLWTCALHHYLCNETPQLFSPLEWFSEAFYGQKYPLVVEVVVSGKLRNCYDHFLRFGITELRQPHQDVDLKRYAESLLVRTAVSNSRDVFTQWLSDEGAGADHPLPEPMSEGQSKQLFVQAARNMLPQLARQRLDFTVVATPAISVIVVLYNQFDLTMMALSSLRANYRGDIELILIDSGSFDETHHIGRYVAGARIIRFARNVGFVTACNAALPHVSAPAILYLNNDLVLANDALALALGRLQSSADIGAVGAKVIRSNGLLQEAGCMIWRDGSTLGYLRDADANAPEANFVRDVDFCSGAFLMVRTELVKGVGGFDEDYRPAYYEESDLCVQLIKRGFRIVYDPSVVVHHLEYGSSSASRAVRMIARNQKVFAKKHLNWLRYQYPSSLRNTVFARSARSNRRRVLFFEDRIPLRKLGSGYVRSNDIVRAMASLGYDVSIFPIARSSESVIEIFRDFPDTVEVLYDRDLAQFRSFIAERSGYYNIVWVGRSHNLDRLLPLFNESSDCLPIDGFVLDTEAVCAPRTVDRARLLGLPIEQNLRQLLKQEFSSAYFCQSIVAVNDRDAESIRTTGHSHVRVLGHMQDLSPTPRPWEERKDLLFVGALHENDSPNHDSLKWFVTSVLPLLRDRLPMSLRLTVAGYIGRDIDMSSLSRDSRVELIGPLDDLSGLYDSHRVFIAPTRFAGGIPFKLHEAASFGLPIVATDLLCLQVGWTDGVEIISGGTNDPARFAAGITALYENSDVWAAVRAAALRRLQQDNSRAAYQTRLGSILDDVLEAKPQH